MTSECQRIQLLLKRDGPDETRKWVERTLRAYREALDNPHSHASQPNYRPLFETSVHEFEAWLGGEGGAAQYSAIKEKGGTGDSHPSSRHSEREGDGIGTQR